MSVFKEGVRDFRVGQIANPYKPNTTKNKNWEMGFSKAYFDNLERVKQRETRNAKGKENIGAGSKRV